MFRKVESVEEIERLLKRVKYNWQKRLQLAPSQIESCHFCLRRDTLGYLRPIFGGAERTRDRCQEIRNVHVTSEWKIIVNSSVIFTNICSFQASATEKKAPKMVDREEREMCHFILVNRQFLPHCDVCRLR